MARSTTRKILTEAGISSPKRRRPPQHRCRRERMQREGVLVQMDGSYHDWLEGRGQWLTLLLAVDDATGTIPYALFQKQEDARGYFKLLWGIIQLHGIPLAVYTDRHSVFQASRRQTETAEKPEVEKRSRTQVGRALRELGISQVFARSPEAKGRVERMAGTFQDRLVSELRLAGTSTLADANRVLQEFLPRFNKRFQVPPAEMSSAYRPLDESFDLACILCFKHNCKVSKDNTVKYQWKTLQLMPSEERFSFAGVHAEIQEHLDGNLVVRYKGHKIHTQDAPPRAGALRQQGPVNAKLANLPRWLTDFTLEVNGNNRKRIKPVRDSRGKQRGPTLSQKIRWEAVQAANQRGLSIRAIARELNFSKNTVKRHLAAPSPPIYPDRRNNRTIQQDHEAMRIIDGVTESLVTCT